VAGRSITVGELLESVLRDRLLYETTGGGVTVSGGEPALQPSFTGELIGELRRLGVHTAVETAGNVPWADLAQAVAGADLILFDLKHADPAAHARWTGATNELIVANLRRLATAAAESGQRLVVRIPIIPGANSDQAALMGMAALLAGLPHLDGIELLPYHNLGVPKYGALRREYAMPDVNPPTSEELRLAAGIFREAGLEVKLESEGSR